MKNHNASKTLQIPKISYLKKVVLEDDEEEQGMKIHEGI